MGTVTTIADPTDRSLVHSPTSRSKRQRRRRHAKKLDSGRSVLAFLYKTGIDCFLFITRSPSDHFRFEDQALRPLHPTFVLSNLCLLALRQRKEPTALASGTPLVLTFGSEIGFYGTPGYHFFLHPKPSLASCASSPAGPARSSPSETRFQILARDPLGARACVPT